MAHFKFKFRDFDCDLTLLILMKNLNVHQSQLTGAKRREFSGMIPVITSNVIIPAAPSNPSIPYVLMIP